MSTTSKIRIVLSALSFISTGLFAEVTNVYIAAPKGGLYHATLNSDTGDVSPITQVAKLNGTGFLAFHPNKKILYATTAGYPKPKTGGIASLKINDDYSLSFIEKQPTEGIGTCHLSVDGSGSTLVASNYSSRSITTFKIRNNGSLEPANGIHEHQGSGQHPRRQKKPHPHSAFFNPANTYAYVPDLGIDKIIIYAVDTSTSTLSSAGSVEVTGGSRGPRHLKISNDGKYVYLLNEFSMDITIFQVSAADGSLKEVQNLSIRKTDEPIEGMTSAEIRIHPNGKFLYASNRDNKKLGRDTLSTLKIHPDGKLSLVEVVNTEVSVPRNFNIDPSGQWILVGGQASQDISIFKVDPQIGTLKYTKTIPIQGNPICIEFL